MGGFYTKKSANMGLISTPTKDPETWVKFVENRVLKNHGNNFGKLVGLPIFEKKLAKSLNKRGSPFSFVFPKK